MISVQFCHIFCLLYRMLTWQWGHRSAEPLFLGSGRHLWVPWVEMPLLQTENRCANLFSGWSPEFSSAVYASFKGCGIWCSFRAEEGLTRTKAKNAGSHWKFASTKGDHRLKSYGCLDADLPLPRSGIHFHPCPCLQEAFRPTSSHPKFFHPICPTKLGREVPTLFRRQWAWTPSWAAVAVF